MGEEYSNRPQINQKVAGTLLHMNSKEFLAGFQESSAAETHQYLFIYLFGSDVVTHITKRIDKIHKIIQ